MPYIEDFRNIPAMPGYSACLNTNLVVRDMDGRCCHPYLQQSSCRWYWLVSIRGKAHRLHRLIASAAIGRELLAKEQVHHIDGNPHNNQASNLRVGTAAENARDKIAHGTNGRVLSNAAVREIRALVGRLTTNAIACRYKVTPSHVRAIATRRRWANLP